MRERCPLRAIVHTRCSIRAPRASPQLDHPHRDSYSPRVLRIWIVALALLLSGCIDSPTEHRVRANAYLRGGDAEKALAEVAAGLAKDPRDVGLWILKGKALFELERMDDSRAAYQAAIDNVGDLKPAALSEAHLGLAMIAMRSKDYKQARTSFEALVGIDGTSAHARINLARICLQMDDLPCAIEHGEEAGRRQGDSEEVLFTLGRIYLVAKKHDDAEKTFQHICEVVPAAASCPYGVALVAAQRGDKARALDKLKEAIDKKMPNPEALADDPLLAPLADDEAFKALAAKAKSG
jgi:tetratricopeptide (TPR) repeat protein